MLTVEGVDVYSEGEFARLMRDLKDEVGSGVLQEWWMGVPKHPSTIYATLDIEARLAAETPQAEELVDVGLKRMEDGLPDAEFMKGRG